MSEGFTPTQLEQLRELLGLERQHTESMLDSRFKEERTYVTSMIDSRFKEERTYVTSMIDSRFKEERQYTAAIITEKLRPLESKIDRLFETETEDVQAVASDVIRLDKRVTKIEQRLELHA